MRLFLMRHGEAGYDAHSDRERVLTEVGRYQTGLMSNWLTQKVAEFDLVVVSPYLRAQQSWQEVSKHFPEPKKWLVLDEITPSADPQMAVELVLAYAEQYEAESVLIISHMPLLGYMVSELVAGVEPPLFATSAITLIEKQGRNGEIVWQDTPHTVG